jgi:hypothetical protein
MEEQASPQPIRLSEEAQSDSSPASPLKPPPALPSSLPDITSLHLRLNHLQELSRQRQATLQRLLAVSQDLQSQEAVQGDERAGSLDTDRKDWKRRL